MFFFLNQNRNFHKCIPLLEKENAANEKKSILSKQWIKMVQMPQTDIPFEKPSSCKLFEVDDYVINVRLHTCSQVQFTSFPYRSALKMAEQNAKPSDLYKCVYSFLLENKFTKAAAQFVKQTKVVSRSSRVLCRVSVSAHVELCNVQPACSRALG